MLQVARLAPKVLGEATELVGSFVLEHLNDDGGFRDRDGASDLYYSVFGLESLIALQRELPIDAVARFLSSHGDGEGLDLIHLSCLARCWACLKPGPSASPGRAAPDELRSALAARLSSFRSDDGGYHVTASADAATTGTVYGCFLALGAYQDLGLELPEPDGVFRFVESMATADGGFSNERAMSVGTTPATAAAVALLRHLRRPAPPAAGEWLAARCKSDGGFLAAPQTPLPDLLSTAVALHALAGLEHPIETLREPCLDFIDSLWTNRGSFYATWADQELDCEYTYYGLLALGHLGL